MAPARIARRLAAILTADVAGYTRLMERDERGTFERLRTHRETIVGPAIAEHHGRLVKLTGDGVLCEFGSVVDAVACAMQIQAQMQAAERERRPEERISLRVGISLGDIIHETDGDIYGDSVNVAARLEALAEPGGIILAGTAYEHVRGKVDCGFEDLGERALKNIERPMRLYRVLPPSADGGSVPAEAGLALPDRPSIAVLPFTNMSPAGTDEFFSDGITEDITTALCKLKGFFVIARNTMFTYKGKPVNVRAVGRELGVRYVLEGSVRQSGDRMRVTAQLIDAASGNHLWADRYDRNVGDIFAIQDEITASVVACIGPELLVAEHARASRKPPQSLDAWECVIRALFQISQLSQGASRDALTLLDQAIARDPGYAQALGLQAWIVIWRAFQGWIEMEAALARVKPLIARAIASDEDEPWTYLAQGMMAFAVRDEGLAMSALTQATTLNPNFAYAHGLLGIAHAFGGRATEALACIDHAIRLSPREVFSADFHLFYGFAHFVASNYAEAMRCAEKAHQLRPGHPWPLVMATACAGHVDPARANARLDELRRLVPVLSADWLEATAPFVRAEDRSRLIAGLARAGLA